MDVSTTYGGYAIDMAPTIQAIEEYASSRVWLQLLVVDGKIRLKSIQKNDMTPCQTFLNMCGVDQFGFHDVIALLQEEKLLLESHPIAKAKLEQAAARYTSRSWLSLDTVVTLKKIDCVSQKIYAERLKESEKNCRYLDGWLASLKELSKEGGDADMLSYLYGELQGLDEMVACLQSQVILHSLDALKDEILRFRRELQEKIDAICTTHEQAIGKSLLSVSFYNSGPLGMSSVIRVPGIENVGNSCYMNSALQGLLVSPVVTEAIDACKAKRGEERFVVELKKFLNSYRAYREKPTGDFHALARCASRLHFELYCAKLRPYIDDLYDMADADLIAMVLGEVLGLEYTLITRRIAAVANSPKPIVQEIETKQFVWPEIKASGTDNDFSLQEMFNQHCACIQEEHNLGWKYTAAITIDDARVGYRLKGAPPALLVFKVGKSAGKGMDAGFTPYKVSDRDEFLNANRAFDTVPEGGAQYRLISLLQNHRRVHWTAVTRYKERWYNCDDESVKKIGTTIPNTAAAVMIYERVLKVSS
ncbi:MAG: ubiquitin carboxyl-terminal hydrolase [Verrucomicrobia bacterium]|nr:ubiquitin carboxyl-terminal hydrolase [Verrucomicrobiota bacterium]